MNILVINGSPKGENSITLQTVRYLEKLNPQHEFTVLDVGMKIRSLEKDFSKAKEAIERADILLFFRENMPPRSPHQSISTMSPHTVTSKITAKIWA